jgi:hypothetical protein
MSYEERKIAAQEAKEEGNVYYSKKEWEKAIEYYTKAIDLLSIEKVRFR